MVTKTCGKCKQEKALTEFWKKNKNTDKYNSHCKTCKLTYRRVLSKTSEKEIATRREISRKVHLLRKQRILDHYCPNGHSCVKCGFSDIRALSVDHINGDGANHRKEVPSHKLYKWLIANKFPEGFQILCMNCQWIKRHENNEFRK